jgi:hypothetical protein
MHPSAKNISMISRIVILPEYQGFGLALKFMKIICQIYNKSGERMRIVTSLKPFIEALKRNNDWILKRFDRISSGSGSGSGSGSIHNKAKQTSFSNNRITASFEYIGD